MSVDHIALLPIRLSIILCLALLGSSAVFGQGTDGDRTGMVLRNVTIISPERIDPLRGAWVAVRDGRIAAVGEGDPDLDQSWSAAQVLDADGRYLTPGLIDSHVHMEWYGRYQQEIDLDGARSYDEAVSRVEARVRSARPGEWLFGHGWDQTDWKDSRLPSHGKLSAISPDNPV